MKRVMERSWQPPFSSLSGRNYEQQRLALLSDRRRVLEDELLRAQQRQFTQARRDKLQRMENQVQSLERSVHNYEVQTQRNTTTRSDSVERGTLDAIPCPSAEHILAQIVKQNELITLLLAQPTNKTSILDGQLPAKSDRTSSELQPSPVRSNDDRQRVTFSDRDEHYQDDTREFFIHAEPTKPNQRTAVKWSSPAALPDIEWTEEDDMMLEKLQAVDPENDSFDESNNGWESMNIGSEPQSGPASKAAEQKLRDREENRKKTAQLLKSTIGSSAPARPRWRIQLDAENGLVAPFSEDGANCMKPIQIFRSAAWAVLMVVALQRLLLEQMMDQKAKSVQDFEAMLNVYFEATRAWLAKLVKVPLLSILQDSSADLNLSRKTGTANSKGFAKKFGALLARRPADDTLAAGSRAAIAHEAKLMKLRVRVKGIVDALIKAIEKQEIPTGILEFWKRLSSDGVYFPTCYELFPSELQVLEFNKLGSTRNMPLMGSISDAGSPKFYSRFNVVLLNFLFIRILIPHVILQPWQVGIGGSKVTAQVALNLKNVATIIYLICRQLSPLPGLVSVAPAKVSKRTEVAPSDEDSQANKQESEEKDDEKGDAEETRFHSIDEIGCLLIPEIIFPTTSTHVQQFVQDQQARLDQALRLLRAQLHS